MMGENTEVFRAWAEKTDLQVKRGEKMAGIQHRGCQFQKPALAN